MLPSEKLIISLAYKSNSGNIVHHPLYGSISEMRAKYRGPLPVYGKYGDYDCIYDLTDDCLEIIYEYEETYWADQFYVNRLPTFDDKYLPID